MISNDHPVIIQALTRFKIALDLALICLDLPLKLIMKQDSEVHRDPLNRSQDLTSKIWITKYKN